MRKAKYNNGDMLKDSVTGLDGIVMVVAFYSTGCIHYGLQPQRVLENGNAPDWTWLDESRLTRVTEGAVVFDISPEGTSGPMPSGPKA